MLLKKIALVSGFILAVPASAQELPVIARVVPENIAELSSPKSGALKELPLQETQVVEQGDLLLGIDCAVDQARYSAMRAASNALNLKYKSQQQLRKFNSSTELEVQIAKAEWERSVAESNIYKQELDSCTLTAPFAGVVSKLSVENFEYIEVGQPVVRLIDDSVKYVEFMAPTEWLVGLEEGDSIRFITPTESGEFLATVSRIGKEVEAVSQTVNVRAMLSDSAHHLRVGIVGQVSRTDGAR